MWSKTSDQKEIIPSKRKLLDSTILLAAYLLSRVFFLNNGFGIDSDSWRIAKAAGYIAKNYTYQPSRFPGYPVVEIAHSLVVKFLGSDWITTNLVTCLIGLASIFVFYRILCLLNIRNKLPLALALIFLPSFWINTTSTMDYIWGLAFVLLGYLASLHKRYFLAAILLGLSVGCRITLGFTILPLLYLIIREKKEKYYLLLIALTFMTFALLAFSPVIMRYGLDFVQYAKHSAPLTIVFYKPIIEVFGWLALGFLVISLIANRKKVLSVVKRWQNNENRHHLIYWLISIIVFTLPYLFLPADSDYLIYALPFFLLMIDYLLSSKFCILLCFLLSLNSFISFGQVDEYTYKVNKKIKVNMVSKGIFLNDYHERKNMLKTAQKLAALKFPAHSYIIMSRNAWAVSYYMTKEKPILGNIIAIKETDTFIVEILKPDELKEVLKEGYQVYYIADQFIPYRYKRNFNIALETFGLKKIIITNKGYIISK